MRLGPSLVIVALAAPLGGCLSWPAFHQPVVQTEASRVAPAEPRAPSRRIAEPQPPNNPAQTVSSRRASVPAQSVTDVPADATAAPTTPAHLSPEWWARENAREEQLRRKMQICRGC